MKHPVYSSYRPSGIPWLGHIPNHWEVKRLRFISHVNPSSVKIDDYETLVTFLPMNNIGESGSLDLSEIRTYNDVRSGYTPLLDNDVCIAKITPCFENGKGAICKGFENGIAFGTTELHVVRAHPTVLPQFIFAITKTYAFRSLGEASMTGAAGQKRVTDIFIKDFPVPLPPLPEQQAIADYLDQETSRVDELVRKKERFIELLTEKRSALISRAVTQGLNPTAPRRPSGITWLGDIPAHWEVKRLKNLFEIFNGSTPSSSEESYWEGSIPWVTPDDLGQLNGTIISETGRYLTEEGYHSCGTSLALEGSIVISTRAPIGHMAIMDVPMCTNQGCKSLSAKKEISSGYFFYQLLSGKSVLQSRGCGSTFQELSKTNLETITLCCPPLSEQKEIAAFLDAETSKIESLMEKERRHIELLGEYRSALITEVVTGRRRIC